MHPYAVAQLEGEQGYACPPPSNGFAGIFVGKSLPSIGNFACWESCWLEQN